MIERVQSPDRLAELFERHRPVHVYGLADLDAPYWERSRWWIDGEAAVGMLELADADAPIVYAVSPAAPDATLDLLARIELPDTFVATGPLGLETALPAHEATWAEPHVKMALMHPELLPPADPGVEPLGRPHLDELRSLYGRVADAGSFFVPDLLDTGHYLGRRDNRGTLVAAAGVHVVSARYGVAAIGNVATHPDHRRAGHARAVVTNLCHRLVGEVATIGLNVRAANLGARTLYRDLGFDDVADFSEAVLVRRRRGDAEP